MAQPDQKDMQERDMQLLAGGDTRKRLLAGLPVIERRLHLHGVSTAVLEGGRAATHPPAWPWRL